MDKQFRDHNELVVLDIKTGINIYRTLVFVPFSLELIICMLLIIFKRDFLEIIINFAVSILFLFFTIFAEKLAYILKLPTNHLFVSKERIHFKKGKKHYILNTHEIILQFHSFYEDFESMSYLKIISNDCEYTFLITKNQFTSIKALLDS